MGVPRFRSLAMPLSCLGFVLDAAYPPSKARQYGTAVETGRSATGRRGFLDQTKIRSNSPSASISNGEAMKQRVREEIKHPKRGELLCNRTLFAPVYVIDSETHRSTTNTDTDTQNK
jgi:hypothetical protein